MWSFSMEYGILVFSGYRSEDIDLLAHILLFCNIVTIG
jgi:predicted glycosyltransferase involved in capsule biosynthesis